MRHIFADQDPDDNEPETRRPRLNRQSTSIRLVFLPGRQSDARERRLAGRRSG